MAGPRGSIVLQCFVWMHLACVGAQADTVVLLNGDRLTGRVSHLSPQSLRLETTYAGTLVIDRSHVATLATDGEVALLLEDEPALQRARIVEAVQGRVGIAPAGELPLDRITHINPKPTESGVGVAYKGRIAVSGVQTRGNTATGRTYGEGQFDARTRQYAYQLGLKGTHATDQGREVASNWFGNGNYDLFVTQDRFYYARGSLENDRFRGLDLRTTAGIGTGLRLFDTPVTQFTVRGGLDMVDVKRIGGGGERYPAIGWGARVSHRILDDRVELFHEQDGFWNLEDTGQATLRSATGVRVPIAAGLSASAQVNVSWEKDPPAGRRPTDSTVLLGLGYEW